MFTSTFFLLLVFVASQGFLSGQGLATALESTLFITIMFSCVVLHEFGHVLAARGYGIRTPDITLLPIGGVARLERMPRKPSEELVVAISGPLVNVIIAAAIYLGLGISTVIHPGYDFLRTGNFFEKLMVWNIFMVVFNLIPAFPMDGGRLLRATLAMFMEYGAATRRAGHDRAKHRDDGGHLHAVKPHVSAHAAADLLLRLHGCRAGGCECHAGRGHEKSARE